MITVVRYHDISCGHRVYGHESKCQFLHGHNYRFWFTAVAEDGLTDFLGRVVDFGVIKARLCQWLEDNWDHKTLLWTEDPLSASIPVFLGSDDIIPVPFNPTAENLANYLLHEVSPPMMRDSGARIISVRVDETRKCSAVADLHPMIELPALRSDLPDSTPATGDDEWPPF